MPDMSTQPLDPIEFSRVVLDQLRFPQKFYAPIVVERDEEGDFPRQSVYDLSRFERVEQNLIER